MKNRLKDVFERHSHLSIESETERGIERLRVITFDDYEASVRDLLPSDDLDEIEIIERAIGSNKALLYRPCNLDDLHNIVKETVKFLRSEILHPDNPDQP